MAHMTWIMHALLSGPGWTAAVAPPAWQIKPGTGWGLQVWHDMSLDKQINKRTSVDIYIYLGIYVQIATSRAAR